MLDPDSEEWRETFDRLTAELDAATPRLRAELDGDFLRAELADLERKAPRLLAELGGA